MKDLGLPLLENVYRWNISCAFVLTPRARAIKLDIWNNGVGILAAIISGAEAVSVGRCI